MQKPRTLNELVKMIEEIIPGCTFDIDNQGQIIVYTGCMTNEHNIPGDMTLVDFVVNPS